MPAPQPISAPDIVNTATTRFQGQSSITQLATGGFVVIWVNEPVANQTANVRAQLYNDMGRPVGGEIAVAPAIASSTQHVPVVAAAPDGGFYAFWTIPSLGDQNLVGQRFSAAGAPVGTQILVADDGWQPEVTVLPNGGLVVTYLDDRIADATMVARFNSAGQRLGANAQVSVSGADARNPAVSHLANNSFVVAWIDEDLSPPMGITPGIRFQLFNSNGAEVGGEQIVTLEASISTVTSRVAITTLANGNFVVAWEQSASGGEDIRARIYTAAGVAVGGEISVNTVTAGEQENVAITALAGGGFAVTWTDNSRASVIMQRLTNTGALDGGEVVIAGSNGGAVSDMTVLSDGRIVVSFQSGGTSSADVFFQMFHTLDQLVLGGAEGEVLNGSASADFIIADAGNDTLNGLGGADTLVGGAGNDIMDGGAGADTYVGGAGNDAYFVRNLGLDGRVEDRFVELANQGVDGVTTAVTLNLNEARYANIENVYMEGSGNLIVGGSAVANVIVGNSGNNGIYGLAGRDIMRGGAGADVFHYLNSAETGKTATTRDLIQDFTVGVDKINLTIADANILLAGDQNFAFLATRGAAFTGVAGQLRYVWEDNANNALDKTIIEGDVNGDRLVDFQIELSGFQAQSGLKALTASDFVL